MAVIHLTKENFEEEVLKSQVPVLIDFWASWCGPCKAAAPIVEEMANEMAGVKICKVNVDEEGELAKMHRVMSIPTFIVYKEGTISSRKSGLMPRGELEELLK